MFINGILSINIQYFFEMLYEKNAITKCWYIHFQDVLKRNKTL